MRGKQHTRLVGRDAMISKQPKRNRIISDSDKCYVGHRHFDMTTAVGSCTYWGQERFSEKVMSEVKCEGRRGRGNGPQAAETAV